ncbi:MAG: anti-sigma factor antagonist [Candidatus Ornithomonoglobus sp.]
MEMTQLTKHRMLVMRMYGELDQRTAGEARSALEREIKRTGAINIAFDFGRVTFMDSSGIGMIIGRYKTVSSLGGRIIVYDASDQVIRLLEMAGLDRLVIIAPTLNEGIKLMKRGM